MLEADLGKILNHRKYSVGTIYCSDLGNNMWAVVVLGNENDLLHSRNFAYTEDTKEAVWANCRHHYKFIKECLMQKRLEDMEEYD